MTTHAIHIHQTVGRLTCPTGLLDLAKATIHDLHRSLRAYLQRHPAFGASYNPIPFISGAPKIIRHLAAAAKRAETGPMAGVAGAIGLYTVRALVRAGAHHVVFENGGDITLKINRPVTVGIHTGRNDLPEMGLFLEPREGIFSCCTSSGTVGHSFSYGYADAAVVLADDPVLADSVATALGNRLRRPGTRSLSAALQAAPWKGIHGMIAIMGDHMGFMGDIPPMVSTTSRPLAGENEEASRVPA